MYVLTYIYVCLYIYIYIHYEERAALIWRSFSFCFFRIKSLEDVMSCVCDKFAMGPRKESNAPGKFLYNTLGT